MKKVNTKYGLGVLIVFLFMLNCSKETQLEEGLSVINFAGITTVTLDTSTRKKETIEFDPTDWRTDDIWNKKEWALFGLDYHKPPYNILEPNLSLIKIEPSPISKNNGILDKRTFLKFDVTINSIEYEYLHLRVVDKKHKNIPCFFGIYKLGTLPNYLWQNLSFYGSLDSIKLNQKNLYDGSIYVDFRFTYYKPDTLRVYYLFASKNRHIRGHGDFVREI